MTTLKEHLSLLEKDPLYILDICFSLVEKDGLNLKYISYDIRSSSLELCKKAVTNNGLALEYVPQKFKENLELCVIAVLQNQKAWEFVSIRAARELKKHLAIIKERYIQIKKNQ